MQVSEESYQRLRRRFAAAEEERRPWWAYWRELADFLLPRRYTTLRTANEHKSAQLRNPNILDGTATIALGVLASGMMNGITSPARPWFRLRVPEQWNNDVVREWLDDVQQRMQFAMAESNFYTSMATVFLDLSAFATTALMIFEDDEDVFRCYNLALGEYFFQQNERHVVDRLCYEFEWRVEQIVKRFGVENCSDAVKQAWNRGTQQLSVRRKIQCIIEPNDSPEYGVAKIHKFRQVFWEEGAPPGLILEARGFREWPNICARWAVIGNDSYGTGPSMETLGDIKQLQHMTKRKAQAMDFMLRPPMLADAQLQHRATALLPGGLTFVNSLGTNIGMKPAYEVRPPIAEISADIREIQLRIREFFYNDLFKMISQLDTVRSATEIDARVEEKLVLLGPVLERFQGEALDPALRRIFRIMLRKGLFLPPPPELANTNIEINYISILNDAQRAVGAAPIERYVSFVGNLGAIAQDVLAIPDWVELTYDYSERLGIPAKDNKTRDEVQAQIEAQERQAQIAQMAEVAPKLAQGAKLLSETDVGGGASALSQMMGG